MNAIALPVCRSLVGVALMAAVALPLYAQSASVAPASRTFRLTYRATVAKLPEGAERLELWLPYPQSDASQTVQSVRLESPVPVQIAREEREGNLVASVRVERPRLPLTVSMEVLAVRREYAGTPESLSPEEARRWLQPEPLVPLDGPVRRLAEEAVRGKRTPGERARAIYEKVTGLLKYDKSGTGWGRGDAVWVCNSRRGNCTDFHALLIGMARSQGIPARFAIGLPLPEARGQGEIAGYHCWAELYVDGRGWVPVDSSEGAKALARGDRAKKDYYFGHHDPNRLELSRGRHLVLSPPQHGGPLNFFVYPYAEVDGKPFDGVERRFTYEDVGRGQPG